MKQLLSSLFVLLQLTYLSAQDKNYDEWYLQREDVEIFVKEIGKGNDTVIVVHGGFGANHDYMLDALEGLMDEFHFILYDQRGSLLSPAKKEDLTFQKNVNDLFALTKALKLSNVKLFCHSMGTLIGMEFTSQHPDLVSHLVLSGAVLPKSDSLKCVFSARVDRQVDSLANRKVVKDMMEPYESKGLNNLRTVDDIEKSQLTHRDLTQYWRIRFAATNVYDIGKHSLVKGGRAYYKSDAAVMSQTVNWKYDYRETLNNKAKTTIINGDHDFFDFNGEMFGALLTSYDSVKLKIISNAGHYSWIDQPKLFRKYLRDALMR
jgi:Predicted hydrolases or acyltransferases (alpha/beta hydrolase superfamily)